MMKLTVIKIVKISNVSNKIGNLLRNLMLIYYFGYHFKNIL